MTTVQQRLAGIISQYWQVPKREAALLQRLVMESSSSRAKFARETLRSLHPTSLFDGTGIKSNPTHAFESTLTPEFWVLLVEDLRAMRLLSTPQAHLIEDCMLDAVDAHGQWKAV